jgi:hypothetical protein
VDNQIKSALVQIQTPQNSRHVSPPLWAAPATNHGHALRRLLGHPEAPLGCAAAPRFVEHPVAAPAAAPFLFLTERSARRRDCGAGATGAAGPSPPRQICPHIPLAARGQHAFSSPDGNPLELKFQGTVMRKLILFLCLHWTDRPRSSHPRFSRWWIGKS